MKVGNAEYSNASDLPEIVAVFPLAGALLLPGGRLPLNIFEPRYLGMVDHALAGSRVIGMVQPLVEPRAEEEIGRAALYDIGCLGRLVSIAETGDGRYLVSLQGICRFRLEEELQAELPFRQCRVAPFAADLGDDETAGEIDRPALIAAFRAYLEANGLETDWDSVQQAENGVLVNALSMMAPYGPAEKQALLEAPDLKTRAATLIAITEMEIRDGGQGGRGLQ